MIYKMTLKDSVDTMTFNLLETPIVDKDIEGAVDNVTLDGNQYTDYLYLKKQYIQKWAIMCPDGYDELRGFYTRQFEEGEVPSYRVYYGANVTRDYTFNGDYFKFNAEGIETGMTLSQLLGNAEQTTYSGKNLARPNGNNTLAGVSFVWNSDGTITLNGTATAAIDVWVANGGSGATEFTIPTGTKLTQSFRVVSGSASDNTWTIRTNLYYGGAAHWTDVVGNTTFIAPSETRVRGLEVLAPSSGLTFNNLRLEIQLEESAAATSWEPYVGGIPAPNPQFPMPISTVTGAQTITVTGKNLQPTTWAQDFVDAVNDSSIASIETFDGKNCLKYQPSAGYPDYPTKNFTLGVSFKENTQYAISFDYYRTGNLNRAVAVYYTDGTNSQMTAVSADAWHHYEFISAADKTIAYIAPYYTSGDSHINADTFQIEEGASASSFEPYHGQSYEVNLGKNLFDAGYYATATYTSGAYKYTTTDFEGGKTYTFSATLKAGKTAISGAYVCISDAPNPNSTQNYMTPVYNGTPTAAHITATFASNATIYFQFYPTTLDIEQIFDTYDFQLEEGSVRTPYQPFVPYHYELCKIGTYQDRIYKNDGKWYIEKQVGKAIFNGSTTLSQLQASTNTTRVVATIGSEYGAPLSTIQLPLCDYFTGSSSVWSTDIQGAYIQSRYTVLRANNATVGTTLDSFKTWLTSHPTTVYYALATPTTTEITDETLLLQLNFLASLYEGENNISLMGAGAQGEMEVFIRDVMSVETDVVPEVPVRLTLTDDGVINACGCRRNVQLTMRETTE